MRNAASLFNHLTFGPKLVAICNGNVKNDEAKITGITPDGLILKGIKVYHIFFENDIFFNYFLIILKGIYVL